MPAGTSSWRCRSPVPGLLVLNQRDSRGNRTGRAHSEDRTDPAGGQNPRRAAGAVLTCGVSLPSGEDQFLGAKPTACGANRPRTIIGGEELRSVRRDRGPAAVSPISQSNAISHDCRQRREARIEERARARSRASERVDRREKARNGRWEVAEERRGKSARRLHFLYSVLPLPPAITITDADSLPRVRNLEMDPFDNLSNDTLGGNEISRGPVDVFRTN